MQLCNTITWLCRYEQDDYRRSSHRDYEMPHNDDEDYLRHRRRDWDSSEDQDRGRERSRDRDRDRDSHRSSWHAVLTAMIGTAGEAAPTRPFDGAKLHIAHCV